jgi:hypothetical protein
MAIDPTIPDHPDPNNPNIPQPIPDHPDPNNPNIPQPIPDYPDPNNPNIPQPIPWPDTDPGSPGPLDPEADQRIDQM